MLKIKLLILISFLFIAQISYAGGPWAAGFAKGYAQIGITLNTYDRLLGAASRLDRTVTDNTLQLYGEYGLTGKWTLVGSVPYKLLATGKSALDPNSGQTILPSGNLGGLGNVMLAAKYTFFQSGLNVAGQLLTESPIYRVDNTTGLRTGYNSFTVCPSLLVGGGSNRIYGFGNLGYALRTGGYSEELRYDLEIGFKPVKRFWIALALNNKKSFKNGTVNEGNVTKTSLYVNNQSYNAFGLKFSYGFTEKIGLNLSAYGAFGGQNVAGAPTFNSSIYYKW